MKKKKKVRAKCAYCKREIRGENHLYSYYDKHFSLHKKCMKTLKKKARKQNCTVYDLLKKRK